MRILSITLLSFLFCVCEVYSQEDIELDEVAVVSNLAKQKLKSQSLNAHLVGEEYLNENRGNSLMTSLEKLPGVSAMHIGQGFSKPIIRGLGFNRVAVFENGIKQQGQQWGADHGLEIDQYNVENIEIIKGPSSLQYGSDAIAGAIVMKSNKLRKTDGFSGTALIHGASNNRLFGGSGNGRYQHNRKYVDTRITYQSFEDYRVPANSFEYLNWILPIHKKILKNTAGRETDLSLKAGISNNKSSSSLSVSNVYAKTGFFAGAHGKPNGANLVDDGDYRNIDFPYQTVNHLKAIANQTVWLNDQQRISVDVAYQNNNRQEYALPHTHGSKPMPDNNLELELRLQTASINASWEYQSSDSNTLSIGLNIENQHNKIGGYAFLLPNFEQSVTGVYALQQYHFSKNLILSSGLRFDYGRLHTDRHIDDYLPEAYQQLSPKLDKKAHDFSLGMGLAYNPNQAWEMKVNLGKSFRMPTANEYASNGVHHGTFRYELGDSTLRAESSYQADVSVAYQKQVNRFVERFYFSTSLFVNYFPNFIFLNPTGEFPLLPDVGQYYKYEQSKALRRGGEMQIGIDFAQILNIESSLEYVHATDLESDYPIPFTPPLNVVNEISIKQKNITRAFVNNRFSITHRYSAAQNRVTRNENATEGYNLVDLKASIGIPVAKQEARLVLQVQNVFDTKYYNHLSFYRNLNLPEIGRNFMLSILVSLGN